MQYFSEINKEKMMRNYKSFLLSVKFFREENNLLYLPRTKSKTKRKLLFL